MPMSQPAPRTDSAPEPDANRLRALLDRQKAAHRAQTPDLAQRLNDLKRLERAFQARRDDLIAAVSEDFGHRSGEETNLSDNLVVLEEIRHLRAHLRNWMRPRHIATDWKFWPGRSEVRYQPLGVVGIIGPWNYPINLTLVPLAAALAAGNQCMLKPSEYTPRTSELLAQMLGETFDTERVAVVTGGPEVAQAFSVLPFDHLLFTGSTKTGRLVMRAAAENLTPVTLELGGKSPTVIDADYPLAKAADRIGVGKFLNAGQTCIAPDYVLTPKGNGRAFAQALQSWLEQAYPTLADNPDYTHIIHDAHYQRLTELAADAEQKGAEVIAVNPANESLSEAGRVFPPTLVLNPSEDMEVMQEEIFGPILPIVEVEDVDAAIEYINDRPRPLALYYFSEHGRRIQRMLDETISGGACINDTLLHLAQPALPFGGIGPSGMGQYHGYAGFQTFSKEKSVYYQARWTSLKALRPPYGKVAKGVLRFLLR